MNTTSPISSVTTQSPTAKTSSWKMLFRIIRWTTYATALIMIILVLHAAPPPPIATSPQAAARAEEKMQDVAQAVSAGQAATLRLDETELNSFLSSHLDIASNPAPSVPDSSVAPVQPASPAPSGKASPDADIQQVRSSVKDVKVQLIEDRVRAYVAFDLHGKDMTLQLEGRLSASDGYLRFEPISGQFGALPLPQSALNAAVSRLMDSPENRERLRLPPEVSDLRIENGQIILTYK